MLPHNPVSLVFSPSQECFSKCLSMRVYDDANPKGVTETEILDQHHAASIEAAVNMCSIASSCVMS